MINCNKKYIFDYISGNDLEGCSIDDLENDPDFMAEVIKATRDKRMYNLCSDDVKKNYDFVKSMIIIFKEDTEFILRIAENYLENVESNISTENVEKDELIILMGNIYDETKDSDLLEYKVYSKAIYENMMSEITAYLILAEKEDIYSVFSFIESMYKGSKIVKDYFAKSLTRTLLFDNGKYTFEELVHFRFKKIKDLEKIKDTTFLVNYISDIDEYLGAYLQNNPELLIEFKESLAYVKKNWNSYLHRINKEKIDLLSMEINRYREECFYSLMFDDKTLLKGIFYKLGLSDIYQNYFLAYCYEFSDDFATESFEETTEKCKEDNRSILFDSDVFEDVENEIKCERNNDEYKDALDFQFSFENFSFLENEFEIARYINHMTKYIRNLFKVDVLNNTDYDEEKEFEKKDKPKCKIIEYNFSQKKVTRKYEV